MVVVTIAVGLVELLSRALMQNISDRTAKSLAGHHDKLVASLIKSEEERIQIYKKLAQERNFEPDKAMTTLDESLIRQAVAETAKTTALKAIPNWLAIVNFVASVACVLICVYAIVLTIWR